MIHHLIPESGDSWELQRQCYCIGMTALSCAALVFFFHKIVFSRQEVCWQKPENVIVSTDMGTYWSYPAVTRLNTRKITASDPSEGPGDLGNYRQRNAHKYTHTAAHIITPVHASLWVFCLCNQ